MVGFREPSASPPALADPLNGETAIGTGGLAKTGGIFDGITIAPDRPPEQVDPKSKDAGGIAYPVFRAKGQIDAPLACFQMLSKYFNFKFRRIIIRKVI